MSNMSYCRFHNTLSDLDDCTDDIERRMSGAGEDEDGDPMEPLSESEADKAVDLILRASDLIQMVLDEIGCDVDELDHTAVRAFVNELQDDCRKACERRAILDEAPARRGDFIRIDGVMRRVIQVVILENEEADEPMIEYHLDNGGVIAARDVNADDVKLESEVGVIR